MEVQETTFNEVVLQSRMPVLVDFWASWCVPCRSVKPVIEELSRKYEGRVVFTSINIDENQGIRKKYGVMGLPTLMIFKDGQPHSSTVGFTGETRSELINNLNSAL